MAVQRVVLPHVITIKCASMGKVPDPAPMIAAVVALRHVMVLLTLARQNVLKILIAVGKLMRHPPIAIMRWGVQPPVRQIFTTTTVVLYGHVIYRIAKMVATIRAVAVALIPVVLPRTHVAIRYVVAVKQPQVVREIVEPRQVAHQRSRIITCQDLGLVTTPHVRRVAITMQAAVLQHAGRQVISV